MGSYAQCWLGNLYVGSSKNDIYPDLMALFRSSDKHVVTGELAEVPFPLKHWLQVAEERPEDPPTLVYYAAPPAVARDRLDLMGYTVGTAREAFNTYIDIERRRCRDSAQAHAKTPERPSTDFFAEHYRKTERVLEQLSVDQWVAALREITRLGLQPDFGGRYRGPHDDDTLLGYILSNEWYGFAGDINVALRLILEAFPESEELVYDITDLVESEYADANFDFVDYALNTSANQYHTKAKIILLTEGKTDSWILKDAIELLYPHLADYYSFMDFDSTKVGGGAGHLANLVKTFAGAGIVNKVIAVFDNDTAGASASKALTGLKVPPHMKVLCLPDVELLMNYPTIGPGGNVNMNVNGMAGSIELYLGTDVLSGDDGQLAPVQWTGLDFGMQRYQGEVIGKDRLHAKFREKLRLARQNPDTERGHWDDLRKVLQTVFAAFHGYERVRICNAAREYGDAFGTSS